MHCTGIDSVLKSAKFANLKIPAQKHVTEYHITNIHIKQKSLQYEIEIEIEIDNKQRLLCCVLFCVPCVASFSELSIFDCPSGIL
jgi:hypothetical protein